MPREAHRILRHGGLLLATEPAFARQIDERVMTRGRYRIPPIQRDVREGGLQVRFASYFTSFGARALSVMKAVSGRGLSAGRQPDLKPLNPAANAVRRVVRHIGSAGVAGGVCVPSAVTLST